MLPGRYNLTERTALDNDLLKQQRVMQDVRALNEAYIIETGSRKTARVMTYGCQQNVSDSEKIKGMLAAMGFEETDSQDADVVIFNTCAVREHAEQRVFGNVGALKPIKDRHPSMIIGLCGCMMQQEHIAKKIKETYTHVDLVFGTGALARFPELLFEVILNRKRIFDIEETFGISEGLPQKRDGRVKAFLPISYGCNNYCTYCVVPYVRGRERSRTIDSILEEAGSLISNGYKEIMLLGQNVNSYGADQEGGVNFSSVLRGIAALEGDFWIRFMTSHPKDATQELFETIASSEKICSHIHLPFQAGSDRILSLMNRRYTKKGYLDLINRAKDAIPGLTLTSDVIVGFPGETREDFIETLDVVSRARFISLFTFIYSKRRGTPAERMPDATPHEEKVERFKELTSLQNEITQEYLKGLEGKTVRVLCEGPGKTGDGYMTGRTQSGTIVDFKAEPDDAGRFLDIHINKSLRFMLIGELKKGIDENGYN